MLRLDESLPNSKSSRFRFLLLKKKRGGGLIRQMRSLNKQQRHCWPISMGLGQMWRKETRKLDNKEEDPFMFKRLVLNRSRARRTGIAIELVNQFFLAIFSVFRWATNSEDKSKLGNVSKFKKQMFTCKSCLAPSALARVANVTNPTGCFDLKN